MRYGWIVLTAAVLVGRAAADEKAKVDPSLVKRGEYLVNTVARCGDCHTPRTSRGALDMTQHLQGADMWFTPKVKVKEFKKQAPDITAGGKTGKWGEARMIKYLMTGKKGGENEEADFPMPAYHLSEEDAKAVTAYLLSLPGGNKGGERKEGERKKKDDD